MQWIATKRIGALCVSLSCFGFAGGAIAQELIQPESVTVGSNESMDETPERAPEVTSNSAPLPTSAKKLLGNTQGLHTEPKPRLAVLTTTPIIPATLEIPLRQPASMTDGNFAERATHEEAIPSVRDPQTELIKEPAFLPEIAPHAAKALPPNVTTPGVEHAFQTETISHATQAESLARKATTREEIAKVIELCSLAVESDADPKASEYAKRLEAWAFNRSGELAAKSGKFDAAVADFSAAVARNPSFWQAIHNRGLVLAIQGNQDLALRDFDQTISLEPQFIAAYRNRAELNSEIGNDSDAARDYSTALELSPNDAEIFLRRGQVYHRQGKLNLAIDDISKSIQLQSINPDAYAARGNVQAAQGQFEGAIKDYWTAIDQNPRHAEAFRSLTWVQATCPNPKIRSPKQAIYSAGKAIEFSQGLDPLAFDALAAAYASSGDFAKAITNETKAIEMIGEREEGNAFRKRLHRYQLGRPAFE